MRLIDERELQRLLNECAECGDIYMKHAVRTLQMIIEREIHTAFDTNMVIRELNIKAWEIKVRNKHEGDFFDGAEKAYDVAIKIVSSRGLREFKPGDLPYLEPHEREDT